VRGVSESIIHRPFEFFLGGILSKVIHFEICVDDPKRAISFYEKAFGWKIQKFDDPTMDYWLIEAGEKEEPVINGALLPRRPKMPPTTNTISVKDIDAALKLIKKNGGKQFDEKMEIPNVGTFAYCTDSEGNLIGVLQPKGGMM